jgi:hypothetical protein
MALAATRIAIVGVAIAGSALAPAAADGATLRAREIADARGEYPALAVDRERFAVWGPQSGPLTVRHMRTGEDRVLSIAPGCVLTDAAYGFALLSCTDESRVINLVSGRTPFIGRISDMGTDSYCCSYYAIGRHWLEGEGRGLGHPYHFHVNWRTRESHRDVSGNVDLDNREFRQVPGGGFVADHDPPFTLKRRRIFDAEHREVGLELLLIRRGRGSFVRRLSRCRRGCGYPQLASGIATWFEDDAPVAYDLRAGIRHAIRFRGARERFSQLRATSTHVVFGTRELGDPPYENQTLHVYAARLPR